MKFAISYIAFVFFIMTLLISCKSEYEQLVSAEKNKEPYMPELILGLEMGQDKSHFFSHCWKLNKKALVSQGPGNKYAKYYMLPDSSTSEEIDKIRVLFYGMFDDDELMYGMEMKMQYTSWAPWNEKYSAESLLEVIKSKYMKEYGGNDYIQIPINDDVMANVKVDANRQILLYKISAKEIMVKIEDVSDRYKKYQSS